MSDCEELYQDMFGAGLEFMETLYKPYYDEKLDDIVGGDDSNYTVFATNILEYTQEMVARGVDAETIQQYINRAKYVLIKGHKIERLRAREGK